jgi:hypothetical protein
MKAKQGMETQPTQVARWTEFFSFMAMAHAHGIDLSGITVTAQLDGVTLDTTVTNTSGRFSLTASRGELTLVFMTNDFELTLALSIPDHSQLSLSVSLQPGDDAAPVVVDQMDATYNPIVCTSDTVTLTGDGELVIDGETCIRATGDCTIATNFSTPGRYSADELRPLPSGGGQCGNPPPHRREGILHRCPRRGCPSARSGRN